MKHYREVAIFASNSTVNSRLYHKAIEAIGIEILPLYQEEQVIIDQIIPGGSSKETLHLPLKQQVCAISSRLKQKECEAIILACTELPALLDDETYQGVNIVNSNAVLASAAVRFT